MTSPDRDQLPAILLVEDDDGIARPLGAALRSGGYAVTRAATGTEALARAAQKPSAVILDLGLPDLDGIEVCRRLREIAPETPILMLTARASEADVVVGLDAGADDYVVKPFRLAELTARLRALLRRSGPRATDEHKTVALDVVIDAGARRAWRGDDELELTPKEFELLALLVSRAGQVVSREDIMREVWDTTWYGNTKTLDMHVSALRRKLGDPAAEPSYVKTVRGVGFRFETDSELA